MKIYVWLFLVVAMLLPAEVFAQCGGFFGRSSSSSCGGSYSGSSCGGSYSNGCGVATDSCGSCQPAADADAVKLEPKVDVNSSPLPTPMPVPSSLKAEQPDLPAAPMHPTLLNESRATLKPVFQTASLQKSGVIKYGVLLINVPKTAKVWINGHLMTTTGTNRKYYSRLNEGRKYPFHIVVKDGTRQAVRDVSLIAGQTLAVK